MSSTSEVGHNKNVANFTAVNQILTEMGLMYQPSNTTIQLANLTPIEATLAASITNLDAKLATYHIKVADRETAFKILDKRMTKVLNYFKSLNVDKKDKEIIAALIKKIRGDHKKKGPNNPETETHSTSQQSYDSLTANLNTLISQLEAFPEYAPNEADITIVSLKAYAQALSQDTAKVNIAASELISTRKNRNDILYFDHPSVIERVKDIKAYLKSLGEEAEPYYKAVVRLKFTDYKP